jgi:hypothetical protein
VAFLRNEVRLCRSQWRRCVPTARHHISLPSERNLVQTRVATPTTAIMPRATLHGRHCSILSQARKRYASRRKNGEKKLLRDLRGKGLRSSGFAQVTQPHQETSIPLAFVRLAPSSFAPFRTAPVKSAPTNSAPLRSACSRFAFSRLASRNLASLRSA